MRKILFLILLLIPVVYAEEVKVEYDSYIVLGEDEDFILPYLHVGGSSQNSQIILYFDIEDREIQNAKLNLKLLKGYTEEELIIGFYEINNFNLRYAESLNFNPNPYITTTITNLQEDYKIDVTSLVEESNGILIRPISYENSPRKVFFSSRSSSGPRLEVTYKGGLEIVPDEPEEVVDEFTDGEIVDDEVMVIRCNDGTKIGDCVNGNLCGGFNLLSNSGFESDSNDDGAPDNFRISPNALYGFDILYTDEEAYQGEKSIKISKQWGSFHYQDPSDEGAIILEHDTDYLFSSFVKGSCENVRVFSSINQYGSADNSLCSLGSCSLSDGDDWKQLIVEFSSEDLNTKLHSSRGSNPFLSNLRVTCADESFEMFVDNMYLQKVDESPSLVNDCEMCGVCEEIKPEEILDEEEFFEIAEVVQCEDGTEFGYCNSNGKICSGFNVIIDNPGFELDENEDGIPDSYLIKSLDILGQDIILTDEDSYQGKNSIKITKQWAGFQYLLQGRSAIILEHDIDYLFSSFIKGSCENIRVSSSIERFGPVDNSLCSIGSSCILSDEDENGWKRLSIEFSSNDVATKLPENRGGNPFLTNLRVTCADDIPFELFVDNMHLQRKDRVIGLIDNCQMCGTCLKPEEFRSQQAVNYVLDNDIDSILTLQEPLKKTAIDQYSLQNRDATYCDYGTQDCLQKTLYFSCLEDPNKGQCLAELTSNLPEPSFLDGGDIFIKQEGLDVTKFKLGNGDNYFSEAKCELHFVKEDASADFDTYVRYDLGTIITTQDTLFSKSYEKSSGEGEQCLTSSCSRLQFSLPWDSSVFSRDCNDFDCNLLEGEDLIHRADLLCGYDEKWYLCDEEGVKKFDNGKQYLCNRGAWIGLSYEENLNPAGKIATNVLDFNLACGDPVSIENDCEYYQCFDDFAYTIEDPEKIYEIQSSGIFVIKRGQTFDCNLESGDYFLLSLTPSDPIEQQIYLATKNFNNEYSFSEKSKLETVEIEQSQLTIFSSDLFYDSSITPSLAVIPFSQEILDPFMTGLAEESRIILPNPQLSPLVFEPGDSVETPVQTTIIEVENEITYDTEERLEWQTTLLIEATRIGEDFSVVYGNTFESDVSFFEPVKVYPNDLLNIDSSKSFDEFEFPLDSNGKKLYIIKDLTKDQFNSDINSLLDKTPFSVFFHLDNSYFDTTKYYDENVVQHWFDGVSEDRFLVVLVVENAFEDSVTLFSFEVELDDFFTDQNCDKDRNICGEEIIDEAFDDILIPSTASPEALELSYTSCNSDSDCFTWECDEDIGLCSPNNYALLACKSSFRTSTIQEQSNPFYQNPLFEQTTVASPPQKSRCNPNDSKKIEIPVCVNGDVIFNSYTCPGETECVTEDDNAVCKGLELSIIFVDKTENYINYGYHVPYMARTVVDILDVSSDDSILFMSKGTENFAISEFNQKKHENFKQFFNKIVNRPSDNTGVRGRNYFLEFNKQIDSLLEEKSEDVKVYHFIISNSMFEDFQEGLEFSEVMEIFDLFGDDKIKIYPDSNLPQNHMMRELDELKDNLEIIDRDANQGFIFPDGIELACVPGCNVIQKVGKVVASAVGIETEACCVTDVCIDDYTLAPVDSDEIDCRDEGGRCVSGEGGVGRCDVPDNRCGCSDEDGEFKFENCEVYTHVLEKSCPECDYTVLEQCSSGSICVPVNGDNMCAQIKETPCSHYVVGTVQAWGGEFDIEDDYEANLQLSEAFRRGHELLSTSLRLCSADQWILALSHQLSEPDRLAEEYEQCIDIVFEDGSGGLDDEGVIIDEDEFDDFVGRLIFSIADEDIGETCEIIPRDFLFDIGEKAQKYLNENLIFELSWASDRHRLALWDIVLQRFEHYFEDYEGNHELMEHFVESIARFNPENSDSRYYASLLAKISNSYLEEGSIDGLNDEDRRKIYPNDGLVERIKLLPKINDELLIGINALPEVYSFGEWTFVDKKNLFFMSELFSEIFIELHSNSEIDSFERAYSITTATWHYMLNNNIDSIEEGLSSILNSNSDFSEEVIIGPNSKLIVVTGDGSLFASDNPRFDHEEIVEFFRQSLPDNKRDGFIISENPEQISDALNALRDSQGEEVVFWYSGHGYDPAVLDGYPEDDSFISPKGGSITSRELASSLKERGSLEEVTLIISACFSFNFLEEVNQYIFGEPDAAQISPVGIAAAGKDTYGLGGVVERYSKEEEGIQPTKSNDFMLSGFANFCAEQDENCQPFFGRHVLESGKYSFLFEDLSVFPHRRIGEAAGPLAFFDTENPGCNTCEGDLCPVGLG